MTDPGNNVEINIPGKVPQNGNPGLLYYSNCTSF